MQPAILIGLGNPGEEYEGTYHNAGREFLSFLQEKLEAAHGPAPLQAGDRFHFRKYGAVFLVWPDTFMNASGEAAAGALRWFGKGPQDIVIFHDDSDLAVGEWKATAESGAAGHHGIESIMAHLGDAPLSRVRIGIRDPREKTGEHPRRKAGDFVLKRITAADRAALEKVFQEIAQRYLD